ncbi:MAG TPA: FAD-dependent oxidoreductase, partial [Bacteroidia bacterium]|nr:FAD-dependent oxidoreductase [Bacteroidia bacterium]
GFIGLEMAENLHHLGMQVSMVEMGNQILAPLDFPIAAIVQQHIRSKGVQLHLGTGVRGFEKTGTHLQVTLSTGQVLNADVVILSMGVKPDTRLAVGAGLQLGPARGIYVNEYMQTSDPDIYAVGDAIEFANPITQVSMSSFLAGPANKQGRICANNLVLGNHEMYNGSINTAIVKVFDMTVATAGMASKHLLKANIRHLVSTTQSGSHAGYYPDARQMHIQLAFSPGTGQLLNAQIAGYDGVDKRIDLLSSVISRRSSVYELTELEHAYAPPFSSAKDPVNIAGFVAENILNRKMLPFYWNETEKAREEGILLDVRTREENKAGSIPGAVSIPLDELRNKLDELPRNKNIFIYCQIGLRGYLSEQILKQSGFPAVYNLSGGFTIWNNCRTELELLDQKTVLHS